MQRFMNMCIELAKKGEGKTSPNPLVGCVVLNAEGDIISTGYHAKAGENHAERDALLKITPAEAQGGTLIVNLEPCSHWGKTPPCTDLIIEYGIKKVVIGMTDPNPKVDGTAKLKEAGIEVVTGVLEKECEELNEVFIVNQKENRTFVALKTATTLDGKIATSTGSSKWITSEDARAEGKKIRTKYDAILTSSATVKADNPQMLHSKKIILDRTLSLADNYEIFKQGECFVYYDENLTAPVSNGIHYIKTPLKSGKLNIDYILKDLFERGIMSILVESGGILSGAFLPYCDKIYNFIAPKILGDNSGKSSFDDREITDINAATEFKFVEIKQLKNDILCVLKPTAKPVSGF